MPYGYRIVRYVCRSNAFFARCISVSFSTCPASLITEWLNSSQWNVINHETNRRPNCMWSILSCAIFSKVSFAIIMVTNDINFLPMNMNAIIRFIPFSFVAQLWPFFIAFVVTVGLFLGFGFIRHNHLKPQIKRTSSRVNTTKWCIHTKGSEILAYELSTELCNQWVLLERWQTTANNYLTWYFLVNVMAYHLALFY